MSGNDLRIYPVGELNQIVRGLLESRFPDIWITGEISNFSSPASGHQYFTLKDDIGQIRCAFFRNRNLYLRFRPQNGLHVVARGRVSLYEPRGDYQFIVEELGPAGEGELQRAFETLKRKLFEEGLFAAERKKPLPRFPRQLGIITSPTGAALRDVLHVLERRYPMLAVVVYPVPVQGDDAGRRIAEAIALAAQRGECDVLLLTRGGGSLEDLWAFNEEVVARAIHACPLPVVSAVGHEIDFTIADLVADVRAPTPSAAAEILSPDANELRQQIRGLYARLESAQTSLQRALQERLVTRERLLHSLHPRTRIDALRQRLDELSLRAQRQMESTLDLARTRLRALSGHLTEARLGNGLAHARTRLADTRARLDAATLAMIGTHRHRLDRVSQRLALLDVGATLQRGFALVSSAQSGQLIRHADQVQPGERIVVRLADGRLRGTVEAAESDG